MFKRNNVWAKLAFEKIIRPLDANMAYIWRWFSRLDFTEMMTKGQRINRDWVVALVFTLSLSIEIHFWT